MDIGDDSQFAMEDIGERLLRNLNRSGRAFRLLVPAHQGALLGAGGSSRCG